jgi:hypothetical protein
VPRYEYACTACGEPFELVRAMDDRDAPAACPSCGGNGERRFSVPVVAQKAARDAHGALAPRPPEKRPTMEQKRRGHGHGPGTTAL